MDFYPIPITALRGDYRILGAPLHTLYLPHLTHCSTNMSKTLLEKSLDLCLVCGCFVLLLYFFKISYTVKNLVYNFIFTILMLRESADQSFCVF